ncbi:MAG: class I SAM-dependent methyltransferase [Oscillospiraceae bacterium]|jgi:SAM-dependent methyltransferase|nr:class I SAM-dependent methyltransferase [Oscillospiraceae bacterium]
MNRDDLIRFYEADSPEELRLREDSIQRIEFLTATRLFDRHLPPGTKLLDSCAGTGAYAFYLAQKGHRVTAGDLVGRNVEILREEEKKGPALDGIFCGDASSLPQFADGAFGAVLLMGALYHLQTGEGRAAAVGESLRLIKPGGILACTYMNRHAVILGDVSGDLDNIEEVLAFAKNGKEGVFYASTPEETAELLKSFGLEIICHAALDGLATFLRHTANILTDKGLERWREYHFATCEVPGLLGYSYHNIILARKI